MSILIYFNKLHCLRLAIFRKLPKAVAFNFLEAPIGFMIPKVAHRTSKTKALTAEEYRLQRRFERILPGWELKHWDDFDNQRLIEEIMPSHSDQFSRITRGVVKADIARCLYLLAHGGFYFDTDYKLLRAIDDKILGHTCVLPLSRSGDLSAEQFRLGNAVMGSQANHPFWQHFLQHLFSFDLERLPENVVESVTGPEALTRFYLAQQASYPDIYLAPRELFHPRVQLKGLSYERNAASYGVHLCWGSWRSKGIIRGAKIYMTRKLSSF